MISPMTPSVRHRARPPLGDDEPQDMPPQGPAGPGSGGSGPDGPSRPPQGGAGRGGPTDDEPELQLKKLSPTGLGASGAAAATASVIGGQLGIAGTVIGAALTSIVSATALAVYTDSVNRSKAKLKSVAEKTQRAQPTRRTPGASHAKSTSRTTARAQKPAEPGGREIRNGTEDHADAQPSGRRRILRTVLLAVVIALIGIVAVFGIQLVTGVELSPGTGEIHRSVTGNESIAPRGDSSPTEQEQQEQQDGVCGCATSALYLVGSGAVPEDRVKVLSTGGMLDAAEKTDAKKVLIATETGMLHQLRNANDTTQFEAVNGRAECHYMKMIDSEKLLNSLRHGTTEITVDETTSERARRSVERMVAIGQPSRGGE